MANDEFPKINRGNGVANDNLATLGDIMLATLKKIRGLEAKIDETKMEISGVKTTIQKIDKANAPITRNSFRLLVASVLIGVIGLVLAFFALHH